MRVANVRELLLVAAAELLTVLDCDFVSDSAAEAARSPSYTLPLLPVDPGLETATLSMVDPSGRVTMPVSASHFPPLCLATSSELYSTGLQPGSLGSQPMTCQSGKHHQPLRSRPRDGCHKASLSYSFVVSQVGRITLLLALPVSAFCDWCQMLWTSPDVAA